MLDFILLDAAPAQGGSNGMGGIIMIVLMIAIFYFFMIRPQSKKQKEMRKFREALQKGDKVTTAGGIHGKVVEIKQNGTVVLEIAKNVDITIDAAMVYPSAQDAVTSGADPKAREQQQ